MAMLLGATGEDTVPPQLSIIVPTLNEAGTIDDLISDLSALRATYEIVVADGGSTDQTVTIARDAGARVVEAPRGRGLQLRAGAAAAHASLLCFLHADVRLDARAAARLTELALVRPPGAFAFRLRLEARGLFYRIIDDGANLRARLLGLPYGDQGLIVRRQDYEKAGGYPPVPLFEDVALLRALRGVSRVRLLDAELRVSARRWRRDGPLRRMFANWALLARYYAGTPPERLAAAYRPEVHTGE